MSQNLKTNWINQLKCLKKSCFLHELQNIREISRKISIWLVFFSRKKNYLHFVLTNHQRCAKYDVLQFLLKMTIRWRHLLNSEHNKCMELKVKAWNDLREYFLNNNLSSQARVCQTPLVCERVNWLKNFQLLQKLLPY